MEKSLKNQKPLGKNRLFGIREVHPPRVKSAPNNDTSATQHNNRRNKEALIEAEYKRAKAVTTFRRYIIR
jgi:hypothetical protein